MSEAGDRGRSFCPHCEESLAHRTYREHVRMFCDPVMHTWTKKRKTAAESGELEDSDQKRTENEESEVSSTFLGINMEMGSNQGTHRGWIHGPGVLKSKI